jgi:hypothetical protein
LVLAGCVSGAQDERPVPGPAAAVVSLLEPPHELLPPGTLSREYDILANPHDLEDVAAGILTVPSGGSADASGETTPTLFWITFARSDDAGNTWRHRDLCGREPDASLATCPFAGAIAIGDPILLFLEDGTLLMAGLSIGAHTVDVFVQRYEPGAIEPSSRAILARGPANQLPMSNLVPVGNPFAAHNDKPQMGLDPATGTVFVTWSWRDRLSSNSQTEYRSIPELSSSADGGHTWSTPVAVATDPPTALNGAFRIGLSPVVSIDGRLHLIGWDATDNQTIQATSTDGGRSFTPLRSIADAHGDIAVDDGYVSIAVPSVDIDRTDGPFRGRIYVATSDTAHGDRDVVVMISDDNGSTWSAPVRANDDAIGNGADQFLPKLVVEPSGAVSVLFMDRRDDQDNQLYHAYLARSTDGGATFSNIRLTETASDPRLTTPLGDYNGLSVAREGLIGLWKDGSKATAADAYYSGFVARIRTHSEDTVP